ncbi:MAG: hypothetical protein ABFS18_14480 [Thermodesulfobacteriota bacterium]
MDNTTLSLAHLTGRRFFHGQSRAVYPGHWLDDVANKCLRTMLIIYGSATNNKRNGQQNPYP